MKAAGGHSGDGAADFFPGFSSPFLVRILRKEFRSGLWVRELFVFLFLAALPILGICTGIYPDTDNRVSFYPDVLVGLSVVVFLWYLPARTLFSCSRERGGLDFIRLLPGGEMGWIWGRFASVMLRWFLLALLFFLFWFIEYAIVGSDGGVYLFRYFVLLCTSVLLMSMSIWMAGTNWFCRFLFCLLLLCAGGYPLLYTLGYLFGYAVPPFQYFYWSEVFSHFVSWLPFVALQTGVMSYAFLVLASRTVFSSSSGQAARLRLLVWLQGGIGTLLYFLSGMPGVRLDVPLPYFTGICLVFACVLFWADAALGMRPVFIRSLCGKGLHYPNALKFPGWQSSVLDFGVLCLICGRVSFGGYQWNGNEAGNWSIVLWFPLLLWANCAFVFMVTRLLFRSWTPKVLPVVIVLCALAVVFLGNIFPSRGQYGEALGLVPFLNLELCHERKPVSWGALVFIFSVMGLYGVLSWGYWRKYMAFVRKGRSNRTLP